MRWIHTKFFSEWIHTTLLDCLSFRISSCFCRICSFKSFSVLKDSRHVLHNLHNLWKTLSEVPMISPVLTCSFSIEWTLESFSTRLVFSRIISSLKLFLFVSNSFNFTEHLSLLTPWIVSMCFSTSELIYKGCSHQSHMYFRIVLSFWSNPLCVDLNQLCFWWNILHPGLQLELQE